MRVTATQQTKYKRILHIYCLKGLFVLWYGMPNRIYNIAYESKQKRTGTICTSPFLFVSLLILQSKLDNMLIVIHQYNHVLHSVSLRMLAVPLLLIGLIFVKVPLSCISHHAVLVRQN